MRYESKIDRVNRIARVLRESFAHIAPRETATVCNTAWVALVHSVYRAGLDDDEISQLALDAVFGNKGK